MSTLVLVDTTNTQTLTNKTLTSPTINDATIDLHAAPTTTLGAATKGYVDGLNTAPLLNASLAASVSSNTLTLSLKTAAGAVPSASDPVRATFRNATDTDGSLVTRSVSAATTLVFSSGSTLGTANATAARIWVGLLDNAGTVELCAWNPLTNSTLALKAFSPNTDVTTTAEGSGTATSAGVLYSTNARVTLPFILLGFIEITEASAGVWATAPTVVQTYRDGMKKTGDIIQTARLQDSAAASGTTTLPNDTTIPQNTEGNLFMTLAITPTSTINLLSILHLGMYSSGNATNSHMLAALFQDSIANALTATVAARVAGADSGAQVTLRYLMKAGTVASTSFKVNAGTSSAGTTRFNSDSTGNIFGGVADSLLMIDEIYV